MKSILLASASVVAFTIAGAASAEISWSGEATLGYNDDDYGDEDGFYWDLEIDVMLSQTLDNGLTAGAEFGFEAADDDGDEDLGQILESKDFVLFLESDMAALYFGNTDMAAQKHWVAAGDMEADGFSEQDGEVVLRGDVMYNGIEASISYIVADADGVSVDDLGGSDTSLLQLSLGAAGTFGNFTVGMAYQEEVDPDIDVTGMAGDFNPEEVFGIFASTSVSGADISMAYVMTSEYDGAASSSSLGFKVAYPFGPVTATAYYVLEDEDGVDDVDDNLGLNIAYADGPVSVALDLQDDQGEAIWSLEGSYDVGSGLVIYAGYISEEDADAADTYTAMYLAGEMDLGGGASLLVSYAESDSDDSDEAGAELYFEDEIGAQEYLEGTTVEMSFTF